MPLYVMVKADGSAGETACHDSRSALMRARRHNETTPEDDRIVDVLLDGSTIMAGPQRSKMDRIETFVRSKGYRLERGETHYVIESESRKLYQLVPRLAILVRQDLGGFVLTGEECLDFRKRKWLYRIVFD